ncbi:MAG TPA: FAD-dependent oxidoreductase, partial [Planctomycetaceae bacterium]|nr:FAD-dependent oxidoreductase [Planctomycetaceae bacterium]
MSSLIERTAGLCAVWLATGVSFALAAAVNQTPRQIPVAREVDVVVVGGSTGAVSAALAAAESGARVFLAAPHPYLGDDMAATLRLWLEEGEEPTSELGRRIFEDEVRVHAGPDPNRLEFTYQASLPSSPPHEDGDPPRMLTDGRWGDPVSRSVQYNGDVTLTADLGEPKAIDEVRLVVYYRGSGDAKTNFKVAGMTVFVSQDRDRWKQIGSVTNRSTEGYTTLAVPVGQRARYVRVDVQKAEDVERMLLGELEIVAPAPPGASGEPQRRPPPRPLHVKKTLDQALLEAGIPFLYSCYATDVLRDGQGRPCGIVMANRAGRQAVVAKVIIDATDRATVARMAAARFRPYPAGKQSFKFVVIGGEVRSGAGIVRARTIDPPFPGPHPNPAGTSSGVFPVIEYTLELPVADASWASMARAEQLARNLTYHPEQQFTSDVLFQVPADPMYGRARSEGPWPGADGLPLDAFRPEGVPRLYVLGGCADVDRRQAEKLLRPLALIDVGARVGAAAAAEARSLGQPAGVHVPGQPVSQPAASGDVRELLAGVRPTDQPNRIPQHAGALPVLGRYDVVVIGGGTGGAPAGIGAARRGAKTLVVEYLHGLGGVGTMGAISKYYWGNRVGFTATVGGGNSWVIEQKKQWYRTQLLEAGAAVWFGTIGCGAFVDGRRVCGAVVA